MVVMMNRSITKSKLQRWQEIAQSPLWFFVIPLMLIVSLHPYRKLLKYLSLVKYTIVGCISLVFGLGALWLFTDIVGIYYILSNILAITASTTVWFLGNALWSFRDRKTDGWSIPKTVVTRLISIGLNMSLMILLVEVFSIWYMLSAFVATLVVFIVSFGLSSKWIWNGRKVT